MKKKILGLGAVALLAVGLAACGEDKEEGGATDSVGKSVDYKITGIDPGAGIMEATDRALVDYELDKWEVVSGSGAAMTAALQRAYDKEEPIIVTGWSPHWKFAKFELKYLEDPEGSFGGAEEIHTIGRLGLEEDSPEAYEILANFKWTEEDMAEVMVEIIDGEEPEVAAQNWLDKNEDKVASWTEGPMWTAVADGSADVLLAGWLPITHKTYAEKFEGKYDDIGTSMEGVKIGLVVPKYMDIDSIEDLKE
ncbi:glycine/betaine ABC transporter [Microvirga sp. 3-52]|nr:glycine/betaine ABC transporter [Microvirga sp. 3-52]